MIRDNPELVGPLMQKYHAATWWFMRDEPVKLKASDVTTIVLEHADMRGSDFGELRLPADQVTTLRAFGLVLGILGQLEATNNWHRIGREVLYGDEPQTELGRVEAEWLSGARV